MLRWITALLLAAFLSAPLAAQNTFTQTTDGGYALTGVWGYSWGANDRLFLLAGNNGHFPMAVKTDAQGEMAWAYVHDVDARYRAGFLSVAQRQDGDFLLSGYFAYADLVQISADGEFGEKHALGAWYPSHEPIAGEGLATFVLGLNYPNPFNTATVIPFSGDRADVVRLAVFDLLGREVAVLVDEHLAPGRYTVMWAAAERPAGLYFYPLLLGAYLATPLAVPSTFRQTYDTPARSFDSIHTCGLQIATRK